MANVISIQDIFAQYVAAYFQNTCKAVHCAYMPFDKDYNMDINGYNVGATLKFRLPTYTNIRLGIVAQPQDLVERFGTITLDTPIGADWNPNLLTLTTDMDSNDKIMDRFVKPSIIKLANQVDTSILAKMDKTVYNVSGTGGATVNSLPTFSTAVTQLKKYGVQGDYRAILNMDDANYLRSALANFFNPELHDPIDIEGYLTKLYGVELFEDQNVFSHTNGTFSAPGNVTIATTAVTGATTLSLTGFTPGATGVLLQGDIIRVASVYAVNPVSINPIGVGTSNLRTFIVNDAQVDADGGGAATVNVSPTIIYDPVDTKYNNVNRLPTMGDIVTLAAGTAGSTYTKSFIFGPEAILLAIKPYFRPNGLVESAIGSYTDEETGLNFLVIDWFDGRNFTNLKRVDMLFGITIQPEYAMCLIG